MKNFQVKFQFFLQSLFGIIWIFKTILACWLWLKKLLLASFWRYEKWSISGHSRLSGLDIYTDITYKPGFVWVKTSGPDKRDWSTGLRKLLKKSIVCMKEALQDADGFLHAIFQEVGSSEFFLRQSTWVRPLRACAWARRAPPRSSPGRCCPPRRWDPAHA